MQIHRWILVALCAVTYAESKQIRIKSALAPGEIPDGSPTQRPLYYYASEDPSAQSEDEQPTVVITRQPHYARATTPSPRPRSTSESPKTPPVQTIRNYNKINDDGSFTFGYEAADGSFKEETRGTDCVVRGKYGYIDPDGNKREFTYVSGNPCDPNAISQEEEDDLKDKANDEEENIPANLPGRRPNYPAKLPIAVHKRPATTLFQQSFNNGEDNSHLHDEEENNQLTEIRQPLRASIRPGFREDQHLIRTTSRPIPQRVAIPESSRYTERPAAPAIPDNYPSTTYRPDELVNLAVSPVSQSQLRPKLVTKPPVQVPIPTQAPIYQDPYRRFQLQSDSLPGQRPSIANGIPTSPVYTTEVLYDPSTGQYNTVVFQQVPKKNIAGSSGELHPSSTPKVPQPFLASSPYPYISQSPTTPRPVVTTSPAIVYQQQLFQQQQAALVKQSQQLYQQQQQQQQQQQHQPLQQSFQSRPFQPYPSQSPSPVPQTYLLKQNQPRYPQPFLTRYPEPKPTVGVSQSQEQFQPSQPFYYINSLVGDQRLGEPFFSGHNLQF